MTDKKYKYLVSVDGLIQEPIEYRTLESALYSIQLLMPCKVIIEAKEE